MSMYEYKEGDHPSGFIGYRVVVSIGGKTNQKHFATRDKEADALASVKAEAVALNEEWLTKQYLQKEERKLAILPNLRNCNALSATGIKGIRLIFNSSIGAKNTKLYCPYIFVSVIIDKVPHRRSFNIKKLGYDDAWFKACLFYAKSRNITDFSKITSKKPPVQIFYLLFRHLVMEGAKPILSQLPRELIKPRLLDVWLENFKAGNFNDEIPNIDYLANLLHEYEVDKAVVRLREHRESLANQKEHNHD